jgi:hypothetical protein
MVIMMASNSTAGSIAVASGLVGLAACCHRHEWAGTGWEWEMVK